MSSFVYVDNSNIWIEGKHVAAVQRGQAPDLHTAQKDDICDQTWVYDFGKLLEFAGGQRAEIKKAVLFGSRPPVTDSLWKAAEKNGFKVVTEDRSYYTNKEKKIDVGIATTIMEDSYEAMNDKDDDVILVAGDRDYVPLVEKLKRRGFKVFICFWDHAAKELKDCATGFYSLNPYLEYLDRNN